jgi:hypothetical protein
MFELTKLKYLVLCLAKALYCHRALYAGFALCHGSGCFLTGKPELYGPMAVLYAVLAVKG